MGIREIISNLRKSAKAPAVSDQELQGDGLSQEQIAQLKEQQPWRNLADDQLSSGAAERLYTKSGHGAPKMHTAR